MEHTFVTVIRFGEFAGKRYPILEQFLIGSSPIIPQMFALSVGIPALPDVREIGAGLVEAL